MSLDCLCRWKVQVYCAMRIPAHLRCPQCSILLHLIDICFLPCICLWQISQIQTCLLVVVGPGLVSTLHAFMRSCASHPAGPHGRLAPRKKGISGSIARDRRGRHNLHRGFPDRCDSLTVCRLCRLVPFFFLSHIYLLRIFSSCNDTLYSHFPLKNTFSYSISHSPTSVPIPFVHIVI